MFRWWTLRSWTILQRPPSPTSPRLPLEPELAADTDTRKQALLQAIDGMIKACPGAGLVRRCTLESAYPAVEREHRAVQAAMAGYVNTQVFFRVLLTGCRGVETLTQVPTIKAKVDLAGFAEAVGQDPSVQDNLRQVLAQYPDVVALLTPEAKLGISLLTCVLSVAASNAQKKHHGGGSASGTGETNSPP